MRNLSKSKLLAFHQCHKRLWLAVHRPELVVESAQSKANFRAGNEVGEIARRLYDPAGKGALVDAHTEGFEQAFARTQALLSSTQPVFEAGFRVEGTLAFADVMLPVGTPEKPAWRMVEVKSSGSVKDYHHNDIAIQAFVAREAGVPLTGIALAHVDTKWTYQGDGVYKGLLKESDLTAVAFARHAEVKTWIGEAQTIVAKTAEPTIRIGRHCSEPFECGFWTYCHSQEPQAKHPVAWLPKVATNALKAFVADDAVMELRQVPDELLNTVQLRVKQHTLAGMTYFDSRGAAKDLAPYKLPAIFLDFETVMLAVPIWKGTHPYQQIPFQFSAHTLSRTGTLSQRHFLDLSGQDPSLHFAEALVGACGTNEPVFVYFAGFETARIKELAERFPALRRRLLGINARVVDLLPIARERYYHPMQKGRWSIKQILPAIAPDLSYDALDGVQDGGLAMEAYQEAIAAETTPQRKAQIERQLLAYCRLDTYAMVRLWGFFTGRTVPQD